MTDKNVRKAIKYKLLLLRVIAIFLPCLVISPCVGRIPNRPRGARLRYRESLLDRLEATCDL